MNKKILIVSLCTMLGIAGTTLVFANFNSKNEKVTNTISSDEIVAVKDIYVKLDSSSFGEKNYLSKNDATLNVLNAKSFENPKVELYQDNMSDRIEVIISDAEKEIKLDKETGELLSYIHLNTSFKENTLNKDEVKKVALELFDAFTGFDDYELYALEEFDEELYLAKFCKRYDKYLNPGELICFGFSPEEKEIVSFAHKSIPFANNEIKLSISDARNAALPYLEMSSATDMTINLEIVELNTGLKPLIDSNAIYKSAKETRLAYVCKFNNKDKTIIYIDCTNGNLIGASWLSGGEF